MTNISYNVAAIREQFPVLNQKVRDNKPLIYLDNAATTQKPLSVIEGIQQYYLNDNSNVHRGLHALSERATAHYEQARKTVQTFINASFLESIVFVRGTTEAINLVAQSYGGSNLKTGDEILLSELEHHSNIVPWQLIAQKTGSKIVVAPINDNGEINQEEYQKRLSSKTKIVAITHASNALGTINPIKSMIEKAHAVGAKVLIDGAQGAPHCKIDVQDLDCDFYAFSSHKMYGPTGIGVLYTKTDLLESMPPYQGGGEMIRTVSFESSTYNNIPFKFEAGTPNIAGAIGLNATIAYLNAVGLDNIHAYEQQLLSYATEALSQIKGLRILGTAKNKVSLISFLVNDIHPHDMGSLLDQEGIAVRVGHHCAMPLMKRLQVPATTRASFSFYNTHDEIDALVAGIKTVKRIFKDE